MPSLESHTAFEVARNITAFVRLDAGLTQSPSPDRHAKVSEQERRIKDQRRRLAEKDRRIQRLEKTLSRKDKRIEKLENRLSRREADAPAATDNVLYDGIVLPPHSLRPCGETFRDDRHYLESAREEARRLARNAGLTLESSLLDVGSGPGRLATGIIEEIGDIEKYRGLDVKEQFVRWNRGNITPRHPNFQFDHVHVKSSRYNPAGEDITGAFTFPYADEEFDIITLYSVFTHMLTEDVRTYLADFRRILKPDGKIFLTAFLEDGVPDVAENPKGYKGRDWSGPLHCIRYDRRFFEGLLAENGFRVDWEDPEQTFQRHLYVSRDQA